MSKRASARPHYSASNSPRKSAARFTERIMALEPYGGKCIWCAIRGFRVMFARLGSRLWQRLFPDDHAKMPVPIGFLDSLP